MIVLHGDRTGDAAGANPTVGAPPDFTECYVGNGRLAVKARNGLSKQVWPSFVDFKYTLDRSFDRSIYRLCN